MGMKGELRLQLCINMIYCKKKEQIDEVCV